MDWTTTLALGLTASMIVYLAIALLRPEWFS